MKKEKSQSKKALKILSKILSGISIVILLCCVIFLISVTFTKSTHKVPRIFGYSFHIVVTDSMTPEIKVNDLVVAKKTDASKIVVGDDIVFVSKDPALKGNQVVHRVVRINSDGSFTTRGIKLGATDDIYPVISPIGKVVAVNTAFGKVFSFIIKYRAFVFMLLIIVIIGIAINEIINIINTLKVKKTAEKEIKEELKKEILQNGKGEDK